MDKPPQGFLDDLQTIWEKGGKLALEQVLKTEPGICIQAFAPLVQLEPANTYRPKTLDDFYKDIEKEPQP